MNRNLRLLAVGMGIRTFGNALYFPFLALFLVNVLRVGYLEVGIIIAGIGAIQIPLSYAGGLLADRADRKPLIILGLTGETISTLALAGAFDLHSLAFAIAAAAGGGIVGSLTGPAYPAYIADFTIEGADRTRSYTFNRIGWNAGFSAGVALGGTLVVLVGFPTSVAIGALLIAVGTGFLAVALDPSPRDLQRRSAPSGPLPSSVLPAVGGNRSLRESFSILAKDRVALELLVAFLLGSLVIGQWSVTFPLFVHNRLGISYAVLGIGLALNGLVVVFGQHWTTESVLGRRHTSIAILGLLLYMFAFLGLAIAGAWGLYLLVAFFVAVFVLTFGENLTSIPAATLPSNVAPKEELGSYNGAFQATGGAGFLIAVLLGGVVLSATSDPILTWVYLLLPVVPAILLFRHAGLRLSRSVDRA